MTLYKEAFLNLLDRFAKKVKEGEYKKVEYNLWRDLYSLAKTNDRAEAEIGKNYWKDEITLDICPIHSDKLRHYEFESDDCSFGEYLAEELRMAKLIENCKLECKVAAFDIPTANNTVMTADLVSDGTLHHKYGSADVYYYNNASTISDLNYSIATQENVTTKADVEDLNQVKKRVEQLDRIATKDIIFEERKENEKMKGFNFEFGSCEHDNVRVSVYGLAVKNATGEWVSYDKTTGDIMNVDILNFEAGKYMFKMPVAIKDVAKGDIVIHGRKPMFVTGVADGKISAIDPFAGEEKVILLTKNCFGFDFVTKVVSLFDNFTNDNQPTVDNPFGNMWMFMLDEDFSSSNNILPMMMAMNNGGMNFNPMMFLLMKDDNKDILPLMMMMNRGCHCGCGKDKID